MGNPVILGRSVTYGAPFGHITGMKVGDALTVTTGQGVFNYKVEDIRYPGDSTAAAVEAQPVPPDAGDFGEQRMEKRLGSDPHRVPGRHARSRPRPAGALRCAHAVSRASLPMQGDPSAPVPLIFWLEVLVVVAVAIGWSWVRWGRMQTWIVGVPVFLLALWGTSNALMAFLPNLL